MPSVRGTVAYWYDIIVAEKENQTVLNGLMNDAGTVDDFENLLTDLKSKSRVAIWRLWAYVIAYAFWVLEGFWQIQKADVDKKAAAAVYANDDWWIRKMKAFQYGDSSLGVKTDKSGVLVIDYDDPNLTGIQIIKFAAITSSAGAATIKVGADLAGEYRPLTGAERSAAVGYVDKLRPAGTNIFLESLEADLIKYTIDVYYNPLENIETSGDDIGMKDLVTNAIKLYHKNLGFNGEVSLTKLVDYIQAVTGVVDVSIRTASAKVDSGNFALFNALYIARSGAVKLTAVTIIEPAPGSDDTFLKFIAK